MLPNMLLQEKRCLDRWQAAAVGAGLPSHPPRQLRDAQLNGPCCSSHVHTGPVLPLHPPLHNSSFLHLLRESRAYRGCSMLSIFGPDGMAGAAKPAGAGSVLMRLEPSKNGNERKTDRQKDGPFAGGRGSQRGVKLGANVGHRSAEVCGGKEVLKGSEIGTHEWVRTGINCAARVWRGRVQRRPLRQVCIVAKAS